MKQTVTENEFIHDVMEIDSTFSREGLKLVFNYLEECGKSDFHPKDVSINFCESSLDEIIEEFGYEDRFFGKEKEDLSIDFIVEILSFDTTALKVNDNTVIYSIF